MRDPLDAFLIELRGAAAGRLPEHIEMIEAAFRGLQTNTNPAAIDDHDLIVDIVRRPVPLVERLQLLADLMQGRLQ